ncbi:DnaD domain protein [Paenibacillus albiflavus]|uniref:DnaD domain protein n=1 Tax=Paenibacillus albiflavus TaxID=2545760 RepID=A0A4R4EM86_9BACL|nr:DnaD domain protein [Paenibacillus albiflavus]TCZ81169.1 DnaD domain protein [Paenibacillus albiflavus]
MQQDGRKLQAMLTQGLMNGTVVVPLALLRTYKRMGLSEAEAMMLIHLIAFTQNERIDFPTIEELQSRMSVSEQEISMLLENLHQVGMFLIDESEDPETGVRYERYNLVPLYQAMSEIMLDDPTLLTMMGQPFVMKNSSTEPKTGSNVDKDHSDVNQGNDLYSIFEKEFARPLTPMELETITGWIDHDGYKEELILAALKEAVFTGKLYFRYVDRILLEWQRNRIGTVEQAKQYSQRFRGLK